MFIFFRKKKIMRKIFLFILILTVSFPLFGQVKDTVYVKSPIFEVIYSQKFQQPIQLTYNVECPKNGVKRTGFDFYTNDSIITSDDNDYYNNVWDKGHLAPAASFNCDRETLKLTFTYLNCALQHQGLNRGPWKDLETFERNLAKVFPDLCVTIDVIFDDECEVLPTGATVPKGFVKKIKFDNKIISFYFPNEDLLKYDWNEFLIK